MIVTAEMSLYPLKESYEQDIIDFIKNLKSHDGIEVMTHAMSTFVRGEQSNVFEAIDKAMNSIADRGAFSLVIKMINRSLPVDSGFLSFD